jgi:hypothetical protein
MAAPATVSARIDRSLSALSAELADLPTLAAEWDTLTDANRASVALDWDHLLADYLAELEDHYRADAMSPGQRETYRDLRRKLAAARPTLARLRFWPLPVPLHD